ncbi:MAG TPA: histidine kinase dimerization/phospho-acceptor domain-containing protein [Longimicrobiales bacterium]|nr:histidine kinase dimerization/phospho-acceptor domain-containing protein [Longimicrobiales bacterium]
MRPVYVAVREQRLRERCLSDLPGAVGIEGESAPEALGGMPPGIVLVDERGPDPLAWAPILPAGGGWTLCAVAGAGDRDVTVRTVSLGAPGSLHELAEAVRGGHAHGCLLDLHAVLSEVSRMRHDLNNPLTSALAEVQLLLLDGGGGPDEESLRVIQDQLRRLRDMLLATRHLRPTPPPT